MHILKSQSEIWPHMYILLLLTHFEFNLEKKLPYSSDAISTISLTD